MPTESILFAPEIDERQLDRETEQVNERLQGVGQDVPVNFQDGGMDGLAPAGAGDMGPSGGGGGGPGLGGIAEGIGALGEKMPGSVAGVTASAAMPIALAGSVGLGMANAMMNASARMQTSASLLGQAWNNIWRPLGDNLDKLFIRDIVTNLLDETQKFSEIMSGAFSGGIIPGSREEAAQRARAAEQFGEIAPGPLSKIFSVGGGALANMLDPNTDFFQIPDFPSWIGGIINPFPNWLQNSPGIIPTFPGWDFVENSWPGWPRIGKLWPGWPNVGKMWPGWPDIMGEWPGWPTAKIQGFSWPDVGTPQWPSTNDILSKFPTLNARSLRNAIFKGDRNGGDGSGGGNDGGGGFLDDLIPGVQTGGRIERTGIAEVHRGELVADPDRLVSELASAVSQASGGGRRRRTDMDTSDMEQKLDELNRNVRRLANSLSVDGVGKEEIARLNADGQENRLGDTDPLV